MTGVRWAGMFVVIGVAVGCGREAAPVPVEKAKVEVPATAPPAADVPATAGTDPVRPPASEPSAEEPERSPKTAPPALEPTPATPVGPASESAKAGEVRDDNGLKLKLVRIPAGTFTMGSPDSEKLRTSDEDQVQVTLTKDFWLGKTEVTQGQWKSVMGTEPWKGEEHVKEGGEFPATYVSWEDAVAFCEKLTEQERTAGRLAKDEEYRLPTEAEWEYACRAGTKTAYSFGDDDSKLSDYAWWGGLVGDGNAQTERYAHAVGLKKPNPWGLHDIHGNVWEWCSDWFGEKLLGGTDPRGATEASDRVKRGGCWDDADRYCRSARRYGYAPGARSDSIGFRVARSSVR